MAGHVQLNFFMMECSKTQIRLTGPICLQFLRYHKKKLMATMSEKKNTCVMLTFCEQSPSEILLPVLFGELQAVLFDLFTPNCSFLEFNLKTL